jgi:hypothetical protein
MTSCQTKAEVIIDLQERGYYNDFILKNEGVLCVQQNELINPDAFEITETYLFDGGPRPNDNFVIYAIREINSGIKGILMASYVTLTSGMLIHLWSKLATHLK